MLDKLIPRAKILRKIIILLWITLAIYLLIKLFGGNFFEIYTSNKRFISVCNYIDNHLWLKIIVCTCTSYLQFYLFYTAILQQWLLKRKQLILCAIIIPIEVAIKLLINNNTASLLIDVFMFFVIPFLLKWSGINKKFIFLFVGLGNVLLLAFQIISAFIRNIGIKIMDNNTLLSLIFSFDVFLMQGLYYLYSNRLNLKKGD